MIYRNGQEISGIYVGGRAIAAVYHGARLVWESVKSCFGKGLWIGDKPWLDRDYWKN